LFPDQDSGASFGKIRKMKNLTFLTYSLGCRTNQAEITQIAKELTAFRLTPTDENPDLILINTCVVTAKAERESKRIVRHFRRLYPQAFLVVLGCGVDAKRRLKTELPEADFFVENKGKQSIAEIIARHFGFARTNLPSFKDKYSLSGRALLKIQEGCDRFCSYCIVPFLRGKPKSLPPKTVIEKIQKSKSQGIKEVVLTGTNLALYGEKLRPKTSLIKLLKKILEETKIERISLSSVEPNIINQNFIDLFIKYTRLSPYFHLALQSGSPTVLKGMGRQTDLGKLLDYLLLIKQKIPEFVFRSDILVGFPSETEKEFEETINFIIKAKISFTHVFPFSKRPQTLAAHWIKKGVLKDIPKDVKRKRLKKIKSVAEEIRLTEGKNLVGKILPCLFTQKENSFYRAIASNSWPIKIFSKDKNLRGKVEKVKITGIEKGFLLGTL
jgi:threonylcarbamoyladenosine tRNA methylthiotransferase MtaB